MGLFGKEKTSVDYLKEIAKAQKEQTKATKENWTQKMEHLANWDVKDAEAKGIREENERRRRDYDLAQEEALKNKLQNFYESFDFDLNNLNDIEQKSMAIISWLDTVDRTFKDKKSKDNIDDDNKSKEQMLIKKLALAVERIHFLGKDSAHLDFIAEKLSFYKNRQIEEVAKQQAYKTKVLKLSMLTLLGVAIIVSLILIIPNAKKNPDDCNAKVIKLINKDELDKACSVMLSYSGPSYNSYNEARDILCEALLAQGELDKAVRIEKYKKVIGRSNSYKLIRDYMIEHGFYDKARDYFSYVDEYTKLCIQHMCKNGKYNDARKFVKKLSVDSENPQKFIREMNVIIDSYL